MNGKIGVYVCECGPNIKDRIDIDKVIQEISPMDGVKTVKRFSLLCSNDGKKYLEEEIRKEELSHLVVAACSPREHEQTFMNVCERAGLNPYLLQLINIREQCAWMISDKDLATSKAIEYIRAGIRRVALHQPLQKKEIESIPDVLVIGGGIAGLETSLSLAGKDRQVYLVEKTDSLGGMARKLSQILPYQGSELSSINEKIEQAHNNKNIEIFTSSQVSDVRGFLGNFEINVRSNGQNPQEKNLNVGAIIVATGFSLFNPETDPQYGYREIDNVITALDFEKMINSGEVFLKNGKPPKSIALVHCVGRKETGYCSKVCCLYSMKFAHYCKQTFPDVDVYEFYLDLCLPHKADQDYFEEIQEKGVRFIRSEEEMQIKKKGDQIEVEYKKDR